MILFNRLNKLPMKKLCMLFLSLALLSCSKSSLPGNQPPEENPPGATADLAEKIVAHRGAWKEFGYPDNSLIAFEKALSMDILASECDIQITKDGKVLIYHDEQINGKYVKDLTYQQIQETYKLSNQEDVPLLSTFLSSLSASSTKTHLWMDVKSLSDAAGGNEQSIRAGKEASKLIKAAGLMSKVRFLVGRKAVLDPVIAEVDGKWEVAYMNTAYTANQFSNAGYTWANFSYAHIYKSGTGDQPLFDSYTDKNIKLSVHTVDDVAIALWFLKQPKLYGLTTNNPLIMKNLKL